MKLTIENSALIKPGDVVKFSWVSRDGQTNSDVGVVYGKDMRGIMCNREDNSYFMYGTPLFNGNIDFEILSDHAPVALYGGRYDFVSKHQ